jgi:hypothetical protein
MNNRLPLINLLAYFVLVVVNAIAVRIPFFGKTPGDVSDLFPALLTPADFAFRIWSVIYVLLGVFAFTQARLLSRKEEPLPAEVSAIGLLFLLSCVLNFMWLLTWQSMHIGWAFLVIFILWITLIILYYQLAHVEEVRWMYMVPFSIYLAWMCIAALGNLNILLINSGFDFFGLTEEYWTATLIGIGIGGTFLMLYLNRDIWFTLVLIWAFFGMYVKNMEISKGDSPVVFMSLLAMIVLFVVGSWVGWRKWQTSKKA